MALLNIIRWLRPRMPHKFRVLLRAGGPLEREFRSLADVIPFQNGAVDDCLLQDVSLIYSNTATNGLFLSALQISDIPVITHVHELQCTLDWNGGDNFLEIRNHSSHFIACSNSVAEMLTSRYGINPGRITIIPESIYPAEVRDRSQIAGAMPNEFAHSGNEFVVVGSGTVHFRKGSDLFIQLAEYCTKRVQPGKSIRFVWIGGLSSEFSSRMFAEDVRKLGLDGVVQFLGELENPHPYIAAADLFCLPSREDPFPLVMLEAGALGKAVLGFKQSGGAEEYCNNGGGFLVPYLDVAAMGDLILQYADDKASLVAAGRKPASWSKNALLLNPRDPKFWSLSAVSPRTDTKPYLGVAQLFLPSVNGQYSEDHSLRVPVKQNCNNSLQFHFNSNRCSPHLALRFDPLDKAAAIRHFPHNSQVHIQWNRPMGSQNSC